MAAGSAIGDTEILNEMLGAHTIRKRKMPVKFDNCEMSNTNATRKKSGENCAPPSKSFLAMDKSSTNNSYKRQTTSRDNTTKVLPLSQPLSHAIPQPTLHIDQSLKERSGAAGNVVDDTPNTDTTRRTRSSLNGGSCQRTTSEEREPTGITPSQNTDEKSCCPIYVCKEDVKEHEVRIDCEMCFIGSHKSCLNMSDEEHAAIGNSDVSWYCVRCRAIKANKISWGKYEGETEIRNKITSIYIKILNLRKNIFPLPRGKCGNEFIKEISRLINLFVRKTEWERLALCLVHIFIPIMLQKPSAKRPL